MRHLHLALWNIEDDVLGLNDYEEYLPDQDYRTIIVSSGTRLPVGSIVLCAQYRSHSIGTRIVAIGRVTRRTSVSTRRKAVRVEPFYALDTPIALAELRSQVDHYVCRALDEAEQGGPLVPKLFTSRSKDRILSVMSDKNREVTSILAALTQDATPIVGDVGRRLNEERDAVRTVFEFADIELPTQSFDERTGGIRTNAPFTASNLPASALVNEDDLIGFDLSRFDLDVSRYPLSPAAYVVRDEEIQLTIINVNRKELEKVHGVDLVYYDNIKRQATAVQYKRLDPIRDGTDRTLWVYRRRDELEKQLELMSRPSRTAARNSKDWRITPSPTFFKFVRSTDFDPSDQRLLRGMYVPSGYLELGINDGTFNTGARSGFQISYDNTRYLTRSVFVELVRRGWIGTVKTDDSTLGQMVEKLAEDHEVVFAIRSQARGYRRRMHTTPLLDSAASPTADPARPYPLPGTPPHPTHVSQRCPGDATE